MLQGLGSRVSGSQGPGLIGFVRTSRILPASGGLGPTGTSSSEVELVS